MLKRHRLHLLKRMRTSAVNANARHSRKTRSQVPYRRFSVATVKKIIFTDEKDFTLEVPTNRQNDRVYAKGRKSDICPNRLYHHRNRFSKKLMVSAVVSWNWKTKIFFSGKAEWRTDSAHFLLVNWQMITVTFGSSLRMSDDMNDELRANIVLWHATLNRLYHS